MLYEPNLLSKSKFSCSFPSKGLGIYNNVDYGKLSDKLLWEAFKRGDEIAFTHIYIKAIQISFITMVVSL